MSSDKLASAGGDPSAGFRTPSEWALFPSLSVCLTVTKAEALLLLFLSEESIQHLLVFLLKRLGPWQP